MKKTIIFLTFISIFLLSGCRAEDKSISKYFDNHFETIESYDKVEIKTSLTYMINDNPTALDSYAYIDNDINKKCMASSENDPSGFDEYTAECVAIFGMYNNNYSGFVPFSVSDEVYPVHPVYVAESMEELIITYLDDEDEIDSDNDNEVVFRTSVNYNDLHRDLQQLVTSGFELSFPEIPVIFTVVYNTDLELITDLKIDNSDVMIHIYRENFGMEINMQSYFIVIQYSEYTEELSFFYPDSGLESDDHVNFFDDGDFYGYYKLLVGETIEGELEYDNDQDIILISIPASGTYNLDYNDGSFEQSILFSVYSSNFEYLFEGVISESGKELKDFYLSAGEYYIVLFTHNNATGYRLDLERIS
jgi:hypothetical protein